MNRTRVAIICGGKSSEHEISCVSASGVLAAIDREKFDPLLIGITKSGKWILLPEQTSFAIKNGSLPSVPETGTEISITSQGLVSSGKNLEIDVAFPILHGPYGEDGTIQGLLEMAGVPYVGSGVLASAAAMDKGVMKALFATAGLEQAPYVVITDRDWQVRRSESLDRIAGLGLPLFVKPARAGSSVGITKVWNLEDLDSAIRTAREHDPRIVVEAGVADAREIECGVLVDPTGEPRASACAEIVVHGDHEFYDFEAKYLDDAAELLVPAPISDADAERVRLMSIRAFEALGCEGLARCDWFLTADGTLLINEVNTMPGFTSISMYPRVWAEAGIDYPTLVDRLVQDALRRGTGLR